VKSSSNGPRSHCVWSFGIFAESNRFNTKNSVGWQIAMNVKIEFKLRVTATPGFHSLYDLCFQTMCLFSGAPDDAEDDTAREKHGGDALNSAVKILINAIWTENEEAQQDVAH
jgi:hypothetical protein